MRYSAPVASAVVRLTRAQKGIEEALLDQAAMTEDVLADPRFQLCLAQKAVDGMVLLNNPTAVELLSRVQGELVRVLAVMDSVLPRQTREPDIQEATPTLLPLINDFKPLVDLIVAIDPFLSPNLGGFA